MEGDGADREPPYYPALYEFNLSILSDARSLLAAAHLVLVRPPLHFYFDNTNQTNKDIMKYMLTWTERSQGSPIEYENAQKRILEVFTQWKAPANFKIELFVIRVGDWGGYMMLDCDDPTAVHKFCSMLPAFVFEARPVIPIEDAVRVELESIAFRDGLKAK
jgi:muconolactone delta-isomerase